MSASVMAMRSVFSWASAAGEASTRAADRVDSFRNTVRAARIGKAPGAQKTGVS
jgi:hypothetical protein